MDKALQRRKRKRSSVRALSCRRERLPSGGHAEIVVRVAVVPVVDVEAVPVEVPDVDVVAVRVDERCPFSSVTPKIEVYCHNVAYVLFLLYLIWEQF